MANVIKKVLGDWFGLKDTRVVNVGGGVSRIREDALIKNTTGLVVAGAISSNSDINQAIILNTVSGTVSSYKSFFRKCKQSSEIGVPTTSFSYSTIDKTELANTIQLAISQAYPLASDIADDDIFIGALAATEHLYFVLQTDYSYNVETNNFIYGGTSYTLTGYSDILLGSVHTGYTVSGTMVLAPYTPITFTVNSPRPSSTISNPDGFGGVSVVPVNYWVVYYSYGGNKYIWVANATESISFIETQSGSFVQDDYTTFAPIVAIRNNKNKYSPSYEPTKYSQANACLKLIGLNVDSINNQITDPQVEDVYISLFSNLVSTHQDQLAYNFAFFDYMDQFGVVLAASGVGGIYSYNRLILVQAEIFSADISWAYITKFDLFGTLSADYEYELVPPNGVASPLIHWAINKEVSNYIIRKRTGPTTYTEIVVANFTLNYTVSASEGDIKVFNVPINSDNAAQVIIPVSLKIVETFVPPKYRETLYLRCTHVGVFSKQVTNVPWYQQGWFADLLKIAAVVAVVYGGYQLALAIDASAAALVATGISYSVAITVAIAKYAIIAYATKAVFQQILSSADSSTRDFLTVILVIATVYFGVGFDAGAFQQISTALNAINEILTIELDLAAREFKEELDPLLSQLAKLEEVSRDLRDRENRLINSQIATSLLNLFKGSGSNLLLDTELFNQAGKPELMLAQISSFVRESLTLTNLIPKTMLETEQLVQSLSI